jgi:hypothetical protein
MIHIHTMLSLCFKPSRPESIQSPDCCNDVSHLHYQSNRGHRLNITLFPGAFDTLHFRSTYTPCCPCVSNPLGQNRSSRRTVATTCATFTTNWPGSTDLTVRWFWEQLGAYKHNNKPSLYLWPSMSTGIQLLDWGNDWSNKQHTKCTLPKTNEEQKRKSWRVFWTSTTSRIFIAFQWIQQIRIRAN